MRVTVKAVARTKEENYTRAERQESKILHNATSYIVRGKQKGTGAENGFLE